MVELTSNPAGIVRIIFKVIVDGDRRKFEALSNDDPSAGGGARDLRFRPYDRFGSIFKRMSIEEDENGVYRGNFHTNNNGLERQDNFFFHPPTRARPNEGRLANVDKCLSTGNLPSNQYTTILLLIQDENKKVWTAFTTEHSLKLDEWHPMVKEVILNCLHANRRANVSMVGFVDFEFNESFCNGN